MTDQLRVFPITAKDEAACKKLAGKNTKWFEKGISEIRSDYLKVYTVYPEKSAVSIGVCNGKDMLGLCTYIADEHEEFIYLTDFIVDPAVKSPGVALALINELDKRFGLMKKRYSLIAIEQSLNLLEPLTRILNKYNYRTRFESYLYQHVWDLDLIDLPSVLETKFVSLKSLSDPELDLLAMSLNSENRFPAFTANLLKQLCKLDSEAAVLRAFSGENSKFAGLCFSDDLLRQYQLDGKTKSKNCFILASGFNEDLIEKYIEQGLFHTRQMNKNLLVFNHDRKLKRPESSFVYLKRIMQSDFGEKKNRNIMLVPAGFNP